ncbi:MAG TPA: DUF2147 domain-containing protein [Bacteroidales bacterium]|mgnify:CR=1 FL=1|nr:DUF2147 domain-containing protein [Bacteroidales bacterium]
MMKRNLLTILVVCCSFFPLSAQMHLILGDWYTVDDKTGESYSVVHIYREDNGKYYGKITAMLIPGTEQEICRDCTGADKNQPVLGMVIIRDMVEKNGVLTGGKVLDPETGNFYYGKISYDNGKLKLRGSIDKMGVLGRSQHWKRKP